MALEMDISIGWLETLLKRYSMSQSIEKITSVSYQPAMGNKGENYVSTMIRAQLEVVLGSGYSKKMSLIIKTIPESLEWRESFKEFDVFRQEITMYRDVFPMMERVMRESGDLGEPLWAECYGVRPFDQLVLEDLSEIGFTVGKRREQLNMKHASLALTSLGKFHACLAVVLMKGQITEATFRPAPLAREGSIAMNGLIEGGIKHLYEAMKSWGDEWAEVTEKVGNLIGKSFKRMTALGAVDNSRFNTINHGDFWVNNMMFKYDPETNEPISFRFVDLQIPFYNSVGWDLTYFMFTSIKRDILYHEYDSLLKIYHDSLTRHLKLYKFNMDKAPSFEYLQNEMNRMKFFRFAVTASILSITMAKPEDAADFDGWSEGNSGHNANMFKSSDYVKVAKQDLIHFVENDVI